MFHRPSEYLDQLVENGASIVYLRFFYTQNFKRSGISSLFYLFLPLEVASKAASLQTHPRSTNFLPFFLDFVYLFTIVVHAQIFFICKTVLGIQDKRDFKSDPNLKSSI